MPIIDIVGLEEECFQLFPRPLGPTTQLHLKSWYLLQDQVRPGPALPLAALDLTHHQLWNHPQWKKWHEQPQWEALLQLMCEWAQRPRWGRLLIGLESSFPVLGMRCSLKELKAPYMGEDSLDRHLDKQIDRALAHARARPCFDIELAELFLPLYYGHYFCPHFLLGSMLGFELVMAAGLGPHLAKLENHFARELNLLGQEQVGHFEKLKAEGPKRIRAWQTLLTALGAAGTYQSKDISFGLELTLQSWSRYLDRFQLKERPLYLATKANLELVPGFTNSPYIV